MGIVGTVDKQPDEIDVYAINYTDDMTASDAPASAYAFVLAKNQVGAEQAIAANTTVTTALKRYVLSAGAILTLSGMSVGDRVYVVNKEIVTAATVASADLIDGSATLTLVALHGRALVKTASGWVTEAEVRVIVDVADKRVRNWISGGYSGVTYKIETTMTSAEGRRLQDEILVKVRDA